MSEAGTTGYEPSRGWEGERPLVEWIKGGEMGMALIHETAQWAGAFIKPFAVIGAEAVIGAGTTVWYHAHVARKAVIGPKCVIGHGVFVGWDVQMGEEVHIQGQTHITPGTVIGNRVFFGALVVTMNDKYPKVNNPTFDRQAPIFEDECAIGCGAVILPGVRIGRGAVVGAGSVVTKDVAPEAVVIGNPARLLARIPAPLPTDQDYIECWERLNLRGSIGL